MRARTSNRIWLLAASMLLASSGACGGGGPTTGSEATAGPSGAPTAQIEASPSPGSGSIPAGEPLDLVLLADSAGWGVTDAYAALASEALGREVRVHDHSIGGQTAWNILQGVRGAWADDVAGAEIILFYVHPAGVTPPSHQTCLMAVDAVGGDPDYSGPTWAPGQTWDPPVVTSAADWPGYRDSLDQVYDEIWRLRAGQPTILRAYGIWMPWLSEWRQVGIASTCVANEEVLDEIRRDAAEAHGAAYVSMLDVFNGPQHDRDAVESGWIAEDGMHLSDAGGELLARALAQVGFEASQSPR